MDRWLGALLMGYLDLLQILQVLQIVLNYFITVHEHMKN